jgi:TIR domain
MARIVAKYDVFISHGAFDLALASELSSACRASGLDVYMDGGDPTDETSAESLRKALSRSRFLLLVLPSTGLTTWMTIEIGAAMALGKQICAISQDVSSTGDSPVLARVQLYAPGRIADVIDEIKSRGKVTRKRVASR